jgi:hypothetical protein
MKFKNLLILLICVFLSGCEQYSVDNSKKINLKSDKIYKNSGFALIYNENLDVKDLDGRSLQIFHKSLKKNSYVKITNPVNGKSLIAIVKSKREKFSNFFNSVITNRIVEKLELDVNEPYVEIVLISNSSTFIAKKAKTFDEEKKIANKAPIDGIQISDLNNNKKNIIKLSDNKFSYSIKIADFYYKKTALLMIDRIKLQISPTYIKMVQLSKNNYRVLIGPFNDIKSLKDSFEKMKSFYFENLEILKNA